MVRFDPHVRPCWIANEYAHPTHFAPPTVLRVCVLKILLGFKDGVVRSRLHAQKRTHDILSATEQRISALKDELAESEHHVIGLNNGKTRRSRGKMPAPRARTTDQATPRTNAPGLVGAPRSFSRIGFVPQCRRFCELFYIFSYPFITWQPFLAESEEFLRAKNKYARKAELLQHIVEQQRARLEQISAELQRTTREVSRPTFHLSCIKAPSSIKRGSP